jgi:hypothetical protein
MVLRTALTLGLGTVLICSLSGCSESEQNVTVPGLQEQNKVLKGQGAD